ncbi:MAG: hypothetical protein EBX41_05430 [Chitinophagia bacterium]|nr:hypothetical protein [Chitinophagia bacterium]
MKQKRSITNNVKNLLKEKFIIAVPKLSGSTRLQEDLHFENNDLNMVLFYVEKLFHINIEQSEESSIKSVSDISRIVNKKLPQYATA